MPGGRGTFLDIAYSLNSEKHDEVAKAVKMAIDNGYRVNASMTTVGASYSVCENTKSLTDVWCHAVEKDSVDWEGY